MDVLFETMGCPERRRIALMTGRRIEFNGVETAARAG